MKRVVGNLSEFRDWERRWKEDYRLGHTLLNEHDNIFDSHLRQTFRPPSILLQLLGKVISVRVSQTGILLLQPAPSPSSSQADCDEWVQYQGREADAMTQHWHVALKTFMYVNL